MLVYELNRQFQYCAKIAMTMTSNPIYLNMQSIKFEIVSRTTDNKSSKRKYESYSELLIVVYW